MRPQTILRQWRDSPNSHPAVLLLYLIPLLAACASQPTRLATVGPAPALSGPSDVGKGSLQVFTETREYSDDDVYYFPHSAYQIETPEGNHIRYVWNHHTFQDEDPSVIALPA